MSKSLIILAGGKSKRMKINKEMLKKDGEFIIKNNIRLFEQYFDDIVVVTNKSQFYLNEDVSTTSDVYPYKGPLAGIHAGLLQVKNDCAYVIACDMPYFDVNYMEFIYDNQDESDIIVSKFNGYFEPFQALYSTSLVPIIEKLILEEHLAISNLYREVVTKIVTYENTSFNKYIFVNMNYKSDYLEYLQQKGFEENDKTTENY